MAYRKFRFKSIETTDFVAHLAYLAEKVGDKKPY